MRKITSYIITMIVLVNLLITFPITTYAGVAGNCGPNLSWEITNDGEFILSGSGDMPTYNAQSNPIPWEDHKSKITSVTIREGVTGISSTAFSNCQNLLSVSIASSVNKIASSSFIYCLSLKQITVSDSNKVFSDINGILYNKGQTQLYLYPSDHNYTVYSFPNTLTVINVGAIKNVNNIVSFKIPASVAAIGSDNFYTCKNLQSIIVDKDNQSFCDINGVLLSKSKKTIYKYPMAKTSASYSVPSGVTQIAESCFESCVGLTSISLPNSLQVIGDRAFTYCSRLKNINIPTNVTSIGASAFSMCPQLSSLKIPHSVISIETNAFVRCPTLINVDKNNQNYASINGNLYTKNLETFIHYGTNRSVRTFNIPEGVKTISPNAFAGNIYLEQISLPTTITQITPSCFASCTHLAEVIIPKNITSIAPSAFVGCRKLEAIYYGGSKTEWNNINGISSIQLNQNTKIYFNSKKRFLAQSQSTSVDAPIIKNITLVKGNKTNDIFNQSYTLAKGTTGLYTIKLDVDWNGVASSNRDAYLTQGAVTTNNNAFVKFNNLTNAFENVSVGTLFNPNEPIYVIAMDKSNPTLKSSSVKTKLIIDDLSGDSVYRDTQTGEFNFKLGKDTEFYIPDDVPIIGGMKLTWKMSPIPITIAYEEANKMTVAIGANIVTENKDGIKKFKDFDFKKYKQSIINANKKQNRTLKQLRNDFKLSNSLKVSMFDGKVLSGGSGDVDSGVDVLGYAEVKKGKNGKWNFDEATGYIKVDVSVSYTYNGQVFVWVIPCYYEIGGKLSAGLEADIESLDKSSYAPQLTAYLNASLGINLGAGVGVSKVATFGATGTGTLKLKKGLSDVLEDYIRVWLEANAGYKLAIFGKTIVSDNLWKLSADDGIIYSTDPNDEGKTWIDTKAVSLMSLETAYNEYSVNNIYDNESREYGNIPTEWLGDTPPISLMAADYTNKELTTLATNVYTEAQPQIFDANGTRILIYTSDNENRTAINKQMLVYSVYDESTGTWAKPLPINDDGTSDFYPKAFGNYVVWQNQKEIMDDTYTLADIGKTGEICVAKWNGTTFDTPQIITSNDELDTLPQIAENNGEISVVWLKNTENDVLGVSGTNSIVSKTFDGTSWNDETIIADNLKIVTDLQVGYSQDELFISFIEDTDNDISTINDREIFVINDSKTQITSNELLDSNIVINNGKLYWYENGNIFYKEFSNDEIFSVFTESKQELAEGFTVSESDGNITILWSSAAENGAEIKGVLYQNEEWGDIIDISSLGGYSKYPTCILTENGTILSAFTCEIDNATALCTIDIIPSYNMSIDNIDYDESRLSLETNNEFVVTITNNGELPASDYEIIVYNADGTINNSTIYTDTIKAGETKQVTASFITGESISPEELLVKFVIKDGEEYNYSDNEVSLTIGNSNVLIENIVNFESLPMSSAITKITNNGFDTSSNINVTLRENDENGKIVDTQTIETLAVGESVELTFNYQPSNYQNTKWCVVIETETTEANYGDNSEIFTNDIMLIAEEVENKILSYSLNNNILSINLLFSNGTSEEVSASAHFAVYDKDNRLKGLDTQSLTVGSYQDIGIDGWIENYNYESGDYIKAFIWEDNLKPICTFDNTEINVAE